MKLIKWQSDVTKVILDDETKEELFSIICICGHAYKFHVNSMEDSYIRYVSKCLNCDDCNRFKLDA